MWTADFDNFRKVNPSQDDLKCSSYQSFNCNYIVDNFERTSSNFNLKFEEAQTLHRSYQVAQAIIGF